MRDEILQGCQRESLNFFSVVSYFHNLIPATLIEGDQGAMVCKSFYMLFTTHYAKAVNLSRQLNCGLG